MSVQRTKAPAYNVDLVKSVLAAHGLAPTAANVKKLVKASVDANGSGKLSRTELDKGARALAEGTSEPITGVTPNKPLAEVLQKTPPGVRALFNVYLADPRLLKVNPGSMLVGAVGATAKSISVENNAQGGKDIRLPGHQAFNKGRWLTNKKASSYVANDADRAKLVRAGIDVDATRDLLVVNGVKDPHPIILGFEMVDGQRKLFSICQEVHVFAFEATGGGGGPIMIKKPVIYLYPTKKTSIDVTVTVSGTFTARYPTPEGDTWKVVATPDGTLFDPKTERRYGYLFWEASEPKGMALDPTRAHCVARKDLEGFLETMCLTMGLNDKEKTDFISYWIAPMSRHPYCLVQLVDERTYERYAQMNVQPPPETLIRLFMIFRGAHEPVQCGAPTLPRHHRKGYTLVEWGGAELG